MYILNLRIKPFYTFFVTPASTGQTQNGGRQKQHVRSENGVHCFAAVSGLNDTFPWNSVKRCEMGFEVRLLSFGVRQCTTFSV